MPSLGPIPSIVWHIRMYPHATTSVPKGTAITGCMLWNNDTLLMGKLRGKADAQHIFDSLVPPRDSGWARDPLLVEQMTDTTYGLHLFPFQTSGTRRFRLRYLVPLAPGANELSIRPLMATHLTGTLPAQFRLRLRGKAEGVKVVRGSLAWPAEFPSYQLVDLDATTDVRLRWPAGPAGDGTCAIESQSAIPSRHTYVSAVTVPRCISSAIWS